MSEGKTNDALENSTEDDEDEDSLQYDHEESLPESDDDIKQFQMRRKWETRFEYHYNFFCDYEKRICSSSQTMQNIQVVLFFPCFYNLSLHNNQMICTLCNKKRTLCNRKQFVSNKSQTNPKSK